MGTKIVNGVLVDSTTPSTFVGESATLVAVPGSPVTFTQTYSTATTTQTAPTGAAITFGTNVTAKTPATLLTDAVNTNAGTVATSLDQAQADLGAAINKNTADILVLAKLIVKLIDVCQASGLAL